jgi:hypothetical protein
MTGPSGTAVRECKKEKFIGRSRKRAGQENSPTIAIFSYENRGIGGLFSGLSNLGTGREKRAVRKPTYFSLITLSPQKQGIRLYWVLVVIRYF